MRCNYSFPNPNCEAAACPRYGLKMEAAHSYLQTLKDGTGTRKIGLFCCRPNKPHLRHSAYRVLPNGEAATRLGIGHYHWTDTLTGETLETALSRNHGSRLLPEKGTCKGCGRERQLHGPTHSKRLGEPFWVLRCAPKPNDPPHDPSTYWWKRNGTLERFPAEALERLHRRDNGPVRAPRCNRKGCPREGKAMNPQTKPHTLSTGVTCKILHCECRSPKPRHPVFLAIPKGEVVERFGRGRYRWKDASTGQVFETVPRTADRRPKVSEDPVTAFVIDLLVSHDYVSNEGVKGRIQAKGLPFSWSNESFNKWMYRIRKRVGKPGRVR
jgi:hypothetical protein